jgi:caffeoyl-CoA O-methyltransferase
MRPVTPVGILAAKLESLTQQVKSITGIDPTFKAELQQAYELANGLDPYLDHCTTPESTTLAKLVQLTQAEDWSKRFTDGATVRQLEQEMLSGHNSANPMTKIVMASSFTPSLTPKTSAKPCKMSG